MFASRACAVQMLLVALSRLMCCSRVCMAMRSAGLPSESMLTPMMRPGSRRLYSSWQDRKAAWGPPVQETRGQQEMHGHGHREQEMLRLGAGGLVR
jgi:hypothetical protein